MKERKRLIFTAIAISIVGIVTGLFLGGGLLPSLTEYQIYNKITETASTVTTIGHSHDGISPHEHTITTVVTTTETTPHGYTHDFAATTPAGIAPVAAAPATTPDDNEVWVLNREFWPYMMAVQVGTTVTWINKAQEQHSITFDNGDKDTRLALRDTQGSTTTYTFTEAGTFTYHCDPHPTMTATIVVWVPED
ncbi:MAG: plastocyanin/azurin family copper-binding protein [Dehalococcoidales bacterium]|jgi:plastocyanin|nr:plastocyanin/azurin family copper-binding protein [Dehalococcoidales bacterium]MDP7110103.1 plastocyanin/azurin family copper-binding protein [Dehalococcoidales bacterium]MDP7309641.1 plastocyanin/azurin family copper-binding protein [Dehalococcoidales bacterium]MDP7409426.1 plastocyanin/azurin family copper-binding protein [Dehalococcoidales bacterium]MDP7675761.1 plastocyanin/azurin family copper-binding protein [Dehalococcoidales bacterium]|tara:strand:- start:819 stop:1397 length:579 start_codon:yes stop_codon:yes gene_type:complete